MTGIDLIKYRVAASHIAYYIPNFITEEEEQHLIRKVCHVQREVLL